MDLDPSVLQAGSLLAYLLVFLGGDRDQHRPLQRGHDPAGDRLCRRLGPVSAAAGPLPCR